MTGAGSPRVLMVSRLYRPWIGGTERQAEKLAAALDLAGLEVQVLTGRWDPSTARRELVGRVPVTRHGTLARLRALPGLGTVGGYTYIATLWWHLWRRRSTYDVIHVHGLNYHAFACVKAGRWWHKPVVVKLANSGSASDIAKMREGRQLAGAARMLATALRADRFIALTSRIADELHDAGVPPHRVVQVPNGVDLPTEPAVDLGPGRPRSGAPTTVLYVGRLHPHKDLDTLLRAVHRLHGTVPGGFRLRLVGDGPSRRHLEQRAVELGIASVTCFVGPLDDVGDELAQADLFVLPSETEGLSNALLEAMAAGLAVVASDIPGNEALVDGGGTGLLFPVGDDLALATSLARLRRDDDLRRRLGRAARHLVQDRYGVERVAERYVRLYDELMEGLDVAEPQRTRTPVPEPSP